MSNLPKHDLNRKTTIVPGRVIDCDRSPSQEFEQTKLSTQGKLNVKTMGEPVAIPSVKTVPIVGRSTKIKTGA